MQQAGMSFGPRENPPRKVEVGSHTRRVAGQFLKVDSDTSLFAFCFCCMAWFSNSISLTGALPQAVKQIEKQQFNAQRQHRVSIRCLWFVSGCCDLVSHFLMLSLCSCHLSAHANHPCICTVPFPHCRPHSTVYVQRSVGSDVLRGQCVWLAAAGGVLLQPVRQQGVCICARFVVVDVATAPLAWGCGDRVQLAGRRSAQRE